MIEILDRILLQYKEGSSDKFYELTLVYNSEEEPNRRYVANSRYGKKTGDWRNHGGTMRELVASLHRSIAEHKFGDMKRSKTQKGYLKVNIKKAEAAEKKAKEQKQPTMKKAGLSRFSDMMEDM